MMEFSSRSLLFSSSVVIFLIVTTVLVYPQRHVNDAVGYRQESKKTFHAPKRNLWQDLSEEEARDVYSFVESAIPGLNAVEDGGRQYSDNILSAETLRPNKTDAIRYLHGDANEPVRWAKVAIPQVRDGLDYLTFHMVGPLPVSEHTTILPLEYVFNSGRNFVRNPASGLFELFQNAEAIARGGLADILEDLLGGTIGAEDPTDPDAITVIPRPMSVDSDFFVVWLSFYRAGLRSGERSLLPQGVYAKAKINSANSSEWSIGQMYYNGNMYETHDDLRAAMAGDDFIRAPRNLDGPWTDTEDFDSHPDGRELPPPTAVQPYGRRYRLDREQKFVSWFGFEFFIATDFVKGLTLFDIRFKGDRVMYELGLQEAMAHYAGDDPIQGSLEFLDSFFGMGRLQFELVQGYDCPAYADYLDFSWNQGGEFYRSRNSICIFEYTADHLLSRHTAQYSVTASRNTYLVVRAVSTVGNYDYTFDYIFYMDGTLEVKVRASGFIFAAFYTNNSTKEEDEYGHKIHDALASSMHDHVINFRADLDVAGPSNDMVRMAIEPLTRSYTWDQPEIKERNTMHLVEYSVSEETGLDWPPNSGEFYIIYSADKKNEWGERRGYRITSGTGMGSTVHLTILNSTTLGDAARWAEKDLWVVRHKDTEPSSADSTSWLSPTDPIVNFTAIVDHETLNRSADPAYDGDLVVYFNLGAHHVPHSGDLPNTLMHTSASSVMFVPYNFHDRDPSRESVQGVRLQLKGMGGGGFAEPPASSPDLRTVRGRQIIRDGEHEAKYFGATYDHDLKLSLDEVEPDLLKEFQSAEIMVTDLGINGSAAGVWT